MVQLQQDLADVPSIRLVSFSLDPAYDTPERLQQYAAHYATSGTRWTFVTGELSEIYRLSKESFHLSVAEGVDEAEPIIHSTRLVLVDAMARIRGYYDAQEPEAMSRLSQDVRRLAGSQVSD